MVAGWSLAGPAMVTSRDGVRGGRVEEEASGAAPVRIDGSVEVEGSDELGLRHLHRQGPVREGDM